MFRPELIDQSKLGKYIRHIDKGDALFHAGEMGDSLFIILEGSLRVYDVVRGTEQSLGTLQAGEIVGEKVLVLNAPYRRPCTVRAEVSSVLLEVALRNLKSIQGLMPDFTQRVLAMLSARLDRVWQLTTVLKSLDPRERLARCIVFLAADTRRTKRDPHGLELELSIDELSQLSGLDKPTIASTLHDFVDKKVLLRGEKTYLLPDAHQLLFIAAHDNAIKARAK